MFVLSIWINCIQSAEQLVSELGSSVMMSYESQGSLSNTFAKTIMSRDAPYMEQWAWENAEENQVDKINSAFHKSFWAIDSTWIRQPKRMYTLINESYNNLHLLHPLSFLPLKA